MTHRIKKGDRIRLKVQTVFGWKGYAYAKQDQLTDDPSEVIEFFRENKDPQTDHCIACRFEVARCR